MDGNKNINISISTGTVLKIVGIFLFLAFVYFIRDILMTIFVAIIFAAIIEPLVNRLEEKKIPRGLGVLIIYFGLVIFFVIIFQSLIPPIIQQVELLVDNFPDFWSRVTENFESLKQYSQEKGLSGNIQNGLKELQSSLNQAASGVYFFIISIFTNLVSFVVILVVAFYLVMQKNVLSKVLENISPQKYHGHLIELALKIQDKIGSWARGQLMLALIIGVMSFLGLIFLLPKYALVLALVAGATEIIPYLGPIIGGIPAVFLGFTVPPFSLWRGLAILILYVIIQQLENHIITPQVMKKQVGLNPIVIIIAMLVGARVGGIVGIILAVPVATAVGVIFKDFFIKSDFSELKKDI